MKQGRDLQRPCNESSQSSVMFERQLRRSLACGQERLKPLHNGDK